MVRIPCSKCGSIDHPKYREIKNRGNGIRIPSMASFCVACKKEDGRIYAAKNHEKIKSRMQVYIKKWDEKNRKRRRELINKHQRKVAIIKKNAVDWHYTISSGFNSLTYTESAQW